MHEEITTEQRQKNSKKIENNEKYTIRNAFDVENAQFAQCDDGENAVKNYSLMVGCKSAEMFSNEFINEIKYVEKTISIIVLYYWP